MTTSIDALSNGSDVGLALDEADVTMRRSRRPRRGRFEHRGRHVDPGHRAFRADHLGGYKAVHAGTGSQVEHVLAGLQRSQGERVRDAGERLACRVGYASQQIRRVVEILAHARPVGKMNSWSGWVETSA